MPPGRWPRPTRSPPTHRRGPPHGRAQPVGVVVEVGQRERLRADVPAGQGVVLVPPHRRDRAGVIEAHLQGAHRLAQGARDVPPSLDFLHLSHVETPPKGARAWPGRKKSGGWGSSGALPELGDGPREGRLSRDPRVRRREQPGLFDPLAGEGAPVPRAPGAVEDPFRRGHGVGERAVIASVNSFAAASGSCETSVASPSSTARVPLTTSPVIVRRFATSIRTCWERAWMPVMSGTSPHRASSTDHVASAVVNRTSAARAICSPPPKQWPCTAATTGTGTRRQAQQASWNRLVPRQGLGTNARPTLGGSAMTVAKSSPAQKESPSPASTTARSVRSRRSSPAVRTRSSRVSSVRALSLSGRLSRTWATPSCTWQVTGLDMPPDYGRPGAGAPLRPCEMSQVPVPLPAPTGRAGRTVARSGWSRRWSRTEAPRMISPGTVRAAPTHAGAV